MKSEIESTLSVVICNYNHGHYITEALESVLNQSYKPMEVIVLDDGSTDNSVAIIEELANRHPNLRLERNVQNKGVLFSVNRLMELAQGDYVYCTSADDKTLPGFFEKSMRLLQQHPQAAICSALSLLLGPNGEDRGPYYTPAVSEKECFIPPEEALSLFRKFGRWIVVYSIIFKRKPARELGIFDPKMIIPIEGFWYEVLARKYGACFIPERLTMWRQSEGGYAFAATADFNTSLEIIERVEHEMRSRFADLFPQDYVADWKRRALISNLYGLTRRSPYRHDHIVEVCRRISSPTLADRVHLWALRASLWCSRSATKIYIFYQLPASDKLRIIVKKFTRRSFSRAVPYQ